MNLEKVRYFITNRGILPFIILWSICFALLSVRCLFDLHTYLYGSTIFHRGASKSGYDYLLHLPSGYTDFDGPRPLIIYLHGAGETDKGLDNLKQHDLVRYARESVENKDFPFIVVCPMTTVYGWEPDGIVILLDELLSDETKRWDIDPSRIYLTGMSMGGFGTFRTACKYPDRFTAIVPVAGGGQPENAGQLLQLPTWAFHGNADEIVPIEYTSNMIETMKDMSCKEAKLTTLEGAGHGIMKDVYSRAEVYRWMIGHRR